ncbi:homeodomain-interacting protein kinase, partial [Tanacetum coccineum]
MVTRWCNNNKHWSSSSKYTHVCIVHDQDSKTEYTAAMHKAGMKPEVIIGEPEESVK